MQTSDTASERIAGLRAEIARLRRELRRRTPPLGVLLRRRGFAVYKKEPAGDLLLPAARHRRTFYAMLHKYSFRLFLRDVVKHQDGFTLEQVTRYATPDVTKAYLEYLVRVRLVRHERGAFRLIRTPVRSFGATLEWYVAEVLRQEYGAEALWGVKFRRPAVGGDYDVLAKLDGSLLYLEVKSSPPKQVTDGEVAAFLDRVQDLAPDLALFLMDTELRMKDKIVPMFEQELARRSAYPPPVVRMERELFEINGRTFIINAKESITANIEAVLARWYRNIHAAGRGE
jgi:hypothetical protein